MNFTSDASKIIVNSMDQIEKLNLKIELAILRTGEYKDMSYDNRKEILALLKAEKEWLKKMVEAQEKKIEDALMMNKRQVSDKLQSELEVGNKVVGPCTTMLKSITLSDGGATTMTPLNGETVANWMANLKKFPKEEEIISVLLCGISAIYSFASQGLAHCDIKLTNLIFESRTKIILIDSGSATKIGGVISTTTPGIGFEHYSPSIRYDVNSLSIAISRIMLRKHEKFASKDHLLATIAPLASTYPVVFEMLDLMRIDQDIDSAMELLDVWKNMYEVAKENKSFVSSHSHYAPPE